MSGKNQGNRQGNRGGELPPPPMAEMPSLPGAQESEPQLPGAEEKSAEGGEQLPEGVDQKPLLNDPKAESASMKAVKPVKKGIPVIAARPGYYRMSRRAVGDEFMIADMSELGSWMKLADAKAEEKRQKDAKEKMLAERKKRQEEFQRKLAEKEEAGK